MNSDVTEIAERTRNNARKLLESKQLEKKLRSFGDLFFTGSYLLDLMTWNDIDMQLVPKKGVDPIFALTAFFSEMANDPQFIEAQMIHFKGNYKPKMPRGVYLGLKLDCPEFGGFWKIDLWVLEKADFDKNAALIKTLQSKLTSEKRRKILEYKHEMMQSEGRVPQMGSHMLYQAMLLEGIEEREALFDYVARCGVAV